jgi:hypothetical protein
MFRHPQEEPSVERRQASAPAAEGRRKPTSPWRAPHPLVRSVSPASVGVPLPSFFFSLFFLCSSLPGSEAHPDFSFRWGFASCTSPWTTGSYASEATPFFERLCPVVTMKICRCLTFESGDSCIARARYRTTSSSSAIMGRHAVLLPQHAAQQPTAGEDHQAGERGNSGHHQEELRRCHPAPEAADEPGQEPAGEIAREPNPHHH